MGVEITQEDSVVGSVEKSGKVRGVALRTRGVRRDVNIKDVCRGIIYEDLDTVNFSRVVI